MTSLRLSNVERAVEALKRDLITDTGPQISTLRNYSFAILVYSPQEEFEMRQAVSGLSQQLQQAGWFLHTVNIKALVLERLREFFGEDGLENEIDLEKQISEYDDPITGFEAVKDSICEALEGRDGIASLIAAEIDELAQSASDDGSDRADRTVVFVGQLGAMYPFMRLSALLKLLDGRTHGVPVVFLYPGQYAEEKLSFLDEAETDSDYRPRLYTHDSLVL